MKSDIEIPEVKNVKVAVVLDDSLGQPEWSVFLLNENEHPLVNVLITSVGYSFSDGTNQQKTSTLRHMIEHVGPGEAAQIERIDPSVFHLANEYWVSYYTSNYSNLIYDKKFLFMPDSINEQNLTFIPALEKSGVVHD